LRPFTYMRRHTLIGERILGAAPALANVTKLVRSTHERMDGYRLLGCAVGSRETAGIAHRGVCDAFDAMISDRAYRPAITPEEAVAELRRCQGSQFDPDVVEAFTGRASLSHRAQSESDFLVFPFSAGSFPLRRSFKAAQPRRATAVGSSAQRRGLKVSRLQGPV
jgi:response regulator RpfG family c-di-GMP phosphodiesterase